MEDKKNALLKGAGIAYIAGVMSLILALVLSQLGLYGHIVVEASWVTSVGLMLFAVNTVVGTGLTMGGTYSFQSDCVLSEPCDSVEERLMRLLIDEPSGRKLLISGRAGQIVRGALLGDPRLNENLFWGRWCILDSNGDDVTDRSFRESYVVLRLVFY